MNTSIFVDADWLNMTENVGYGQLPIPNVRDDQICEIVQVIR